ncbi:unnamed protein product (macronuclear) [Paramecium tetraurelia]|uniref:Uncharacterized protein n=1 Tax=Paramecium tetraurelia TaxID=5888 RepID=A0CU59_PARTE|nr:uncharacterized protein GSPATT00010525001 [Paramecium tetraurelia]CAK74326.1 unnamed protein product [Paramecium tetraurelia]|eukprot:XP_001441723.1 hypothetical protein (macronuclear) [Paramecium tetraurelia strain d4-2]
MGNGQCCKRVERVETLEVDNTPPQNAKICSIFDAPQQMISLSDSDEDYQPQKQPQFGVFKDHQKCSQLSTGQQYSFQSLPSEQQFSNFVTFQAIPSQQGIKNNVFSKFQKEMIDVSKNVQQHQKNQKQK